MPQERTFLIYELYIATIATVCGGIFFGIISAMMAIVNTASNPIEAICHIPGADNKRIRSFSKLDLSTRPLPLERDSIVLLDSVSGHLDGPILLEAYTQPAHQGVQVGKCRLL